MAGLVTDYVTRGVGAPSGAPSVGTGESSRYLNTTNNHEYAWDGSAWQDVTGAGGGGAIVLIASNVLGAAAASVVFSSIAAGYNQLQVVWSARGDTAATNTALDLRFNADTSAVYALGAVAGSGSPTGAVGTSGGGLTAAQIGTVPGSTAPSGYFGGGDFLVPRYAATVNNKAAIGKNFRLDAVTNGSIYAEVWAAWWQNTAAVTSITLFPAAGNFIIGSAFYLYGIT